MDRVRPEPKAVDIAVQVLQSGGVVISPTDTVYGFLADAANQKAVQNMYRIKKRPKIKLLPLFVTDVKMAGELAEIDATRAKFLKKVWPGKVTIILKRKLSLRLYGIDKKTVALRIPQHSFLQKVLKKINRPLVQTSVNISGQPPLRSVKDIISQFGKNKNIALIIDAGTLKKLKPSKIIDWSADTIKILRK